MAEEKKEKKGFFKRFWKRIVIISGSIATLVVVAAVVVVVLLTDKTRFSGKIGSDDSVEVIEKNYIEGFKDTSKTGKFTFQIPEDEMNSVFDKASKSINNEYVDRIYYGRGKDNHHYFYIDLNLPVITSRVVIDTLAKEGKVNKEQVIKLSIEKVSLGKINAYNFIKDKGILTSSLFDGFFKSISIPITFNESNNTFTVKPLSYIDNFPTVSTISTTYFKLARESGSHVISINPSILGFTVDFSKFRSSNSLVANDYSGETAPNFDTGLSTRLNEVASELEVGVPHTAYSITKNDLNIALTKSIPSIMKEEVTSKLTKNKVTNSLVNVQTNFIDSDNLTMSLLYSFNGYVIDAVVPLTYVDLSDAENLKAYFQIEYDINVGSYTKDGSQEEGDIYGKFFITNLKAILGAFASSSTLFSIDDDALWIKLENFSSSSYPTVIQNASKEILLDSDQLSFILTRMS